MHIRMHVMCMYMCVCMHTCTYVRSYACVYEFFVDMYVCVDIYICTHLDRECTCIFVRKGFQTSQSEVQFGGRQSEVGGAHSLACSFGGSLSRAAAMEFKLSYHNPKSILFTIYPYHGNLNYVP